MSSNFSVRCRTLQVLSYWGSGFCLLVLGFILATICGTVWSPWVCFQLCYGEFKSSSLHSRDIDACYQGMTPLGSLMSWEITEDSSLCHAPVWASGIAVSNSPLLAWPSGVSLLLCSQALSKDSRGPRYRFLEVLFSPSTVVSFLEISLQLQLSHLPSTLRGCHLLFGFPFPVSAAWILPPWRELGWLRGSSYFFPFSGITVLSQLPVVQYMENICFI